MQHTCQRHHAGWASPPCVRACVPDVSLCRRGQRRTAALYPLLPHTRLTIVHAKRPTFPDNDPVDNPDFDDLELNDEYYRDMGMTKEDIEEQTAFQASDVDPLVRAVWSTILVHTSRAGGGPVAGFALQDTQGTAAPPHGP